MLREAVDAGVLAETSAGSYWFTHPLVAEVLDGDLLTEQRRRMHASYAMVLDGGEPVDLAHHYYRAGLSEQAFRWALRAAEATAGAAERLCLYRRALSLWTDLENPEVGRIELWGRVRVAAEQAGLEPDELEAVEALIALVSRDREPLRLGRLISDRGELRTSMGLDGPDVELRRAAVALTSACPTSADHAVTMARLAQAMLWDGDLEGVPTAATALELAESCGDEEAIAEALVPSAMAKFRTGRAGAEQDAVRACEIALRLRRFRSFKRGVYAAANGHPRTSPGETADIFRRGAEELIAGGAPHSYVAEMCAWEASNLLWIGDWMTCRRRLRVALGARPGRRGDVVARLTAAALAALQGRQAEADGHLARAEEIFPEDSDGLTWVAYDEVRARVALCGDDPERAFDIAVRGLDRSPYVEESLPLAARALADQADACRDAGRDAEPVLARLADLRRRFPVVVPDPGAVLPDAECRAMQTRAPNRGTRLTLHLGLNRRADTGRTRRNARSGDEPRATFRDRVSRGGSAPDARGRQLGCGALILALPAALAMSCDTVGIAFRGRPPHRRRADRLFVRYGAHITRSPQVSAGTVPGLTPQERVILAHVVVGRAPSKIAGAAVLGEKPSA
jgi:hypothetical protein